MVKANCGGHQSFDMVDTSAMKAVVLIHQSAMATGLSPRRQGSEWEDVYGRTRKAVNYPQ